MWVRTPERREVNWDEPNILQFFPPWTHFLIQNIVVWRWGTKHKAVSRKFENQADLLAKFRLSLKTPEGLHSMKGKLERDTPLKKLNTSSDPFQSQTRLRSFAFTLLACQEAKLSPLWRKITSDRVPNYLPNLSRIIIYIPSKITRISGDRMKQQKPR